MKACLRCLPGTISFSGLACAQPAHTTETAAKSTVQRRPLVTEGILSANVESIAPNRSLLAIATKADIGAKMKLFEAAGNEVAVARSADGTIKADVDPAKGYVFAPTCR